MQYQPSLPRSRRPCPCETRGAARYSQHDKGKEVDEWKCSTETHLDGPAGLDELNYSTFDRDQDDGDSVEELPGGQGRYVVLPGRVVVAQERHRIVSRRQSAPCTCQRLERDSHAMEDGQSNNRRHKDPHPPPLRRDRRTRPPVRSEVDVEYSHL